MSKNSASTVGSQFYVAEKLFGSSALNSITHAILISGPLDESRLQEALRSVAERNDMLRATYTLRNAEPECVVGLPTQTPLIEIADVPPDDDSLSSVVAGALRAISAERQPWKAVLARHARELHTLVFVAHRSIWDEASTELFGQLLSEAYARPGVTDRKGVQAIRDDVPADVNEPLVRDDTVGGAVYFSAMLEGVPPVHGFPTIARRQRQTLGGSETVEVSWSADSTANLTAAGKDLSVDPFVMEVAALAYVVAQYCGHSKVSVGMPFDQRDTLGRRGELGSYTSVLPVGIETDQPSFAALCRHVGDLYARGVPLCLTSVSDILETGKVHADPAANALFQIACVRGGLLDLAFDGCTCESRQVSAPPQQLDLFFVCFPGGMRIDYSASLVAAGIANELAGSIERFLASAVENPHVSLSDLTWISDSDRKRVIELFNQTEQPAFLDVELYELIGRGLEKSSDKIALVCSDRSVTYGELREAVERASSLLAQSGARVGELVGICLPRSIDMVVAILATLRNGCAYVPLDPAFPRARLEYMVNHAQLSRVIAHGPLDFASDDVRVIRLAEGGANARAGTPSSADSVAPDAPAYVIYTSGSTGLPKGVVVPRGAVANFLLSMLDRPGLSADDVLCAVTTLSFDISVLELLAPLCVGATIIVATEDEARDPRRLSKLLDDTQATVLQATPATWQLLCAAGWPGNPRLKALCGGEPLRPVLAHALLSRVGELWNMYGPTETTVWSTCKRISNADEPITVGRPIANTSVYVLDGHLRPVPQGIEGDIYIGGAGVTRGYLGNEQLTAEKFKVDPFVDGRMYHTGDRGRCDATGELVVLGRSDFQVKIRGFRIELGDVEVALSRLAAIEEVVCVAQDAGDTMELVAFYSVRADASLNSASLRKHCEASLPAHMIPSRFMQLEALPKTPNGKVDRKALPRAEPSSENSEGGAAEAVPIDDMERLVAEVFRKVLKLDAVSTRASFFEIGGTSLTAFSVVQEIESRTGIEISVLRLFEFPTASALAAHLSGSEKAKAFVDDIARRAKFRRKVLECKTDVAIIGAAGRFPGARTLRALWDNLVEGKETVTFFERDELDPLVPAQEREDEAYIPARGVLEDAQMFDAEFFGITPNEAELMDPQLRVFMEVAWEAFEDAGYVGEDVDGLVGVWGGMGNNFYYHYNVLTRADKLAVMGEIAAEIANEKDHIAPRVSHKLNLTGPSLSVHAACSTGLVAVENAYQALITHQVDYALAGAVDVRTPQKSGQRYEEGGVFSIDGHCRPFDADATGTMFGEGVGIVVLKRLEDALRDGDAIRAVIKGAAINHDGGAKGSYLSPSVEGQARVIATAMALGDVKADTITFMEAHGTATPIGDPIEVEALNRVYRAQTARKNYCALGSVKGNFGHATTAAGIAGLLKVMLSLENRKIPGTLHFNKPNPRIDFAESPFFVNRELMDWARPADAPRRGSTSSFGFCGTNAHVVLEEAPELQSSDVPSRPVQLVLASAKTADALKEGAARLGVGLDGLSSNELADAAYTTHIGRKHFSHRRCAIVAAGENASEILRQTMGPRTMSVVAEPDEPPVTFMFPGQGSQYINMAVSLYRGEPVFASVIDDCASGLRPHLGCDLREFLFPEPGDEKRATQSLNNTFYTQPAIFTISYALALQLMHWGLVPNAFIGHSIGEFVAATLSGVMKLEDALRLVATRGRLMKSLPEGSMLSVRLAAEEVRDDLPVGLDLAAANGPQLCVVAGPTEDLQRFAGYLEERDVKCRMLHTSHAFHSSMMDPVVVPFAEVVRSVSLSKPTIPFVSTVTGQWITDDQATDPMYWATHLRSPVLFAEAVKVLLEDSRRVMIECGPRRTLTTLALQQRPKRPGRIFGSMPDSAEPDDEYVSLMMALGSSWANGCEIDWQALHEGQRRLRRSLPAYAFQRKRFWIEPGALSLAEPRVGSERAMNAQSDDVSPPEALDHGDGDPIMRSVVNLLEESLGGAIQDFDADAPFVMLGLDSLLVTQLARMLRVRLGFQVTFRKLTEQYSTPRLLAEAISAQQPERAAAAPAIREQSRAEATAQQNVVETESPERADDALELGPKAVDPECPLPTAARNRVDLASTPGQLEMWLTDRADRQSSCAFNEAFQIELTGAVDEQALHLALRALPDYHAALRGVFSADGERFIILPHLDVNIAIHDLSSRSSAEQDAEIRRIAAEDSRTPYDLLDGPLFRATRVRLGAKRHVILLSAHHSVCDGWSLDVLLADLGKIYTGLLEGKLPPPPAHSFANFVEYRQSEEYRRQLDASRVFWSQTLSPAPAPLALPHDGKRPPRRTYAARHYLHEARRETHQRIREFAKPRGLSFFSVLLAGYMTLLHRLSGATDIVVGTPVAGHPDAGMEDCVGHLASMVPVRSAVDASLTFEQLCRQINGSLLDAREHASVGFGEIVAQMGGARDPSRVPLLAAVITHVQRYREDQLKFAGCQVDYHLSPRSSEIFELNLNVIEGAESLTFKGHVNADLYSEQWLRWRLAELDQLLNEACAAPDSALSEIPMMPTAELELVNGWADSGRVHLNPDVSLVDLLERQARLSPDAIAVTQGAEVVSYAQLHREAARLAHLLSKRGAKPGVLVGICVSRSVSMVRAVLAVLKSGAAYVPLDPAFPQNRIAYMIEHAGIDLVVSERALRDIHQCPAKSVLEFDDVQDQLAGASQLDLPINEPRLRGDAAAYVLYTSGSTGKPKGVVVSHRAAVNFLQSMAGTPGLDSRDRLLAVTTLSFDISVLELLLPLSVGARIVLATKEQTLDGQALRRLIETEQVSIMQATPVTWRLLLEAGWKGGETFKALCGGEAMPVDLASALLERGVELWNMYGPTETTVWSTCGQVTDPSKITVGRPIANTVIRVLDAQGRPCPVGVPGEIHIGGDGLSNGYLHRPDLTQERFIADPVSHTSDELLYKTGDLGRWLSDGVLDCLGRNDNQIKLRGFRIELGEIEAALASHPDVQEAAVQIHTIADGPQLVAYLVLRPGKDGVPADLSQHLARFLPRYMLPTSTMILPALPQTANGKLDRKALPVPAETSTPIIDASQSSRNDIEAKVREVFVKYLHAPSIGVHDDFFDEGGHSLLAIRAINDLNAAFGTEFSVATLFENPTIEGMARALIAGHGKLGDTVIQLHDAGNDAPPFFFVCGIALYQPFALNMGNAFSSYGLYIPQEEEFLKRHDSDVPVTIPELAKAYVEAILTHPAAAQRTCYVGGVSFGGLLAFEVARQLQAHSGFAVASLVLLDAVLPHAFIRNLRTTFAHHLKRTHEGGIAYLSDRIRKRFDKPRAVADGCEREVTNDERLTQVLKGRAVQLYLEAKPSFGGETLIVRATNRAQNVGFDVTSDLGWGDYLAGTVSIVDAPGDHLGILRHELTAARVVESLKKQSFSDLTRSDACALGGAEAARRQ